MTETAHSNAKILMDRLLHTAAAQRILKRNALRLDEIECDRLQELIEKLRRPLPLAHREILCQEIAETLVPKEADTALTNRFLAEPVSIEPGTIERIRKSIKEQKAKV